MARDYKRNKFSGIYLIRNNNNGKCYVGSSVHILYRIQLHQSKLRNNKNNHHPYLQKEYNEFNGENFEFIILESFIEGISLEELREKEWSYMEGYETFNPDKGYNQTHPVTREHFYKLPTTRTCRYNPIICISVDSIIEFSNSQEASEKLGLIKKKIEDCCSYWNNLDSRKRYLKKSHKGYIFVKKSIYNPEFDYLNYKKDPVRTAPPRPKKERVYEKIERTYRLSPNAKPIRLEKDSEFLYFSSIKECVRVMGMLDSKIRHALKQEYKQRSHHGYWFKSITIEEYLEHRCFDDIVLPEKSKHLRNVTSDTFLP